MPDLIDTIHVNVEYFEGQDEGDVGYPYYVASCDEIAAVTDARTLDALMLHIQEVIALYLEGADAQSGIVSNPRIIVMIELSGHAEAA
jgi:predicted RNase H-like HicB family nuclease